jgi:hypothetical protein
MKARPLVITLATIWLAFDSSPALGDGGTLRFSGRRGDRVITVFTAPAPLRAGAIDLSVLVQDAETGKPITHVPVSVQAQLIGQSETAIRAVATNEAATNKLMSAATLELLRPGRWRFDLSVQGLATATPITFDAEIADAQPPWLDISLWIAWPLLPIGLFVLHRLRLRRRPREASERHLVTARQQNAVDVTAGRASGTAV